MSEEPLFKEVIVSWEVDDIEVFATLTRPLGQGPFPAVIFVAGSGPTDRDWNTPLIPGTNGSGALLARELAGQGYVTLRYDKRASGPHAAENVKNMTGKTSMQGHVAELAGGVRLLAGDPAVNPARIFVLTNSEGCVHALNYQTQAGNLPFAVRFAGMVLTSAFARLTGDVARSQIAAQLAAVPGGDGFLAAYDAAMQAFAADQPVPVDDQLPPAFQQIIQAITLPINQPFARELWIFNPAVMLAEIRVPVLIVIGKKDIQVDWQTDGPLFEAVARQHPNVRIVYMENASHVLKLEAKPRDQLTPGEVMQSYSAAETHLDPLTLQTITAWLKDLL